ncbi:MAG: sulfotransferase [Planctomycetota bacterium]|nr:sulfotransferase [Planctomycetota bacterium]
MSSETFDALMNQQRFSAAADLADQMKNRQPGNGYWWVASGRAMLALGRLQEASENFDRAIRLMPMDSDLQLQRAIVDHRLGRSVAAADRLQKLIKNAPMNLVDATIVLAEVLHRSNRQEELDRLVAVGGEWTNDPRAQLFVARRQAVTDRARAITTLDQLARSTAPAHVRRIAGFEAIRMLDGLGRYREAFDLAAFMHSSTGTRHDIGGLESEIQAQKNLLARGKSFCPPRAPRIEATAMILALPRSGTTLVEQMLDRHPAITGIGEYGGIHALSERAISSAFWPNDLALIQSSDALAWQKEYQAGAAFLRRPGTSWTLDKNLHAWRWLPLIASILPGTVMIAIDRDPRDTAISTFLGNFHPTAFGWSGSIQSIGKVIAAHRSILPRALEILDFVHESIVYEDLIADPAGHSSRCLAKMGLVMDEATLAPEGNLRTVLTLSHDQVRRPINRASIGRWRNYEWAFDESWNSLAALHDARRRL